MKTASPTSLTCRLDTSKEPVPFERLPVSLKIVGIGSAIVAPQQNHTVFFELIPSLVSLRPTRGSTLGGTKLVIEGKGFLPGMQVKIGGSACNIRHISYTKIDCTTPPYNNPEIETLHETISLIFQKHDQELKGICSPPSSCLFSYSKQQTPTVNQVQPSTINSPNTVLTINGTKFTNNVSEVIVMVGNESCIVLTATETNITCNLRGAVVGSHSILVIINGDKGHALFTSPGLQELTSEAALTSISPTQGSLNGGLTLTINGNGFDPQKSSTVVVIGQVLCRIKNITTSLIKCTTGRQEEGSYLLTVTSKGHSFPTATFTANAMSTPVITSITPSEARSGSTITIQGSYFATDPTKNNIQIDETDCEVTSSTATTIVCTLLPKLAGEYPLTLHVVGEGFATSGKNFTYQLNIDSVAPPESGFGGGRLITIKGSGFSPNVKVSICSNPCDIVKDFKVNDTTIQCEAPAKVQSSPGADDECELVVIVSNPQIEDHIPRTVQKSLPSAYTYKNSLTSTITSVSPARGGTGGGVILTITGSGFSTTPSLNRVTIDGTLCLVISSSTVEIKCTTGQHSRTIKTKVRVDVGSNGAAVQQNDEFYYVDVWSSKYSWGGLPPPKEGKERGYDNKRKFMRDIDCEKISFRLKESKNFCHTFVDKKELTYGFD